MEKAPVSRKGLSLDVQGTCVALVSNDHEVVLSASQYLESFGLRVAVVDDDEGGATTLPADLDCVVVESRRDDVALCQELRTTDRLAIVVLAGTTNERARLRALEAGADDVIVAPFAFREVLARVHSKLRRVRGTIGPSMRTIRIGALSIDPPSMTVALDGAVLSTTAREFAILRILASRVNSVVSRSELLELVLVPGSSTQVRTVDVLISNIRAKLRDSARKPRLLKTVRGGGYMLVA